MTDTSSSRHKLAHQYATHGEAFPGALTEHGATAQQLRAVEPVKFLAPQILGQTEVGKPVLRRADRKKPRTTRVSSKQTRK